MRASGGEGRTVVEDVLVVGGATPNRLGEGIGLPPQLEDPLLHRRYVDVGIDAGEPAVLPHWLSTVPDMGARNARAAIGLGYRVPVSVETVSSVPEGALIRVWVVPGASRSEIVGIHDGRLKIRVTAPPEAGRANREVARLLGERLGSRVELASGSSSREKGFLVRGGDPQVVERKLTR